MLELPELPIQPIQSYETVPTLARPALIRLPRCGVCFEEVHDCKNGVAYCAVLDAVYRVMDEDQRERWETAESLDNAVERMEPD